MGNINSLFIVQLQDYYFKSKERNLRKLLKLSRPVGVQNPDFKSNSLTSHTTGLALKVVICFGIVTPNEQTPENTPRKDNTIFEQILEFTHCFFFLFLFFTNTLILPMAHQRKNIKARPESHK